MKDSASKPDATPSKEAKHTPEWEVKTYTKKAELPQDESEKRVYLYHGHVAWEPSTPYSRQFTDAELFARAPLLLKEVEDLRKKATPKAIRKRTIEALLIAWRDAIANHSQRVLRDKGMANYDTNEAIMSTPLDLFSLLGMVPDMKVEPELKEVMEERDQLRERNEALKAEKHQATQDWSNLIAKHKTANDELRERNRVLEEALNAARKSLRLFAGTNAPPSAYA